ncbi:MAG TPA: alkaline phosphatase family protein [Terriglobales bacterium]|nr:alkaline phosphatase family protein [Terriglobales bacterium]
MIFRATVLVCIFLFASSMLIAQSNSVPRSGHVVLIIEENHPYSQVYPSGMPWLVSQVQGNGAIASNFTSPINNIGSLGAYLWLSSGSTETQFGCNGGGCTSSITDDNIFRELDMRGMTWKVYAQSLASVGYTGDGPYPYVKRHNPAVWYSSILDKSTDLQRVVPFTQFAQDLASNNLPEYSIIIPDLQNDAHDGSLAQADAFLKTNINPLLQSSYFAAGGDGLLLLTFDECGGGENSTCGAHIFSAMFGPHVRKGYVSSAAYNHSNMLRTIEDALGLQPYFGAATNVTAMTDFFSTTVASGSTSCTPPSSPGAVLCTPSAGRTYGSPVLFTGAGTAKSGSVNHLELWVDGKKVNDYSGAVLNTSTVLASGTHTATLVEVEPNWSYIKSAPVTFTVGGCTPPTSAGAKLCSPVAGQSYSSPVAISGAGTVANGSVNHLELWLDGHKIGNYFSSTMTATVSSSSGTHTATLVAVDANGNYVKSTPATYSVK